MASHRGKSATEATLRGMHRAKRLTVPRNERRRSVAARANDWVKLESTASCRPPRHQRSVSTEVRVPRNHHPSRGRTRPRERSIGTAEAGPSERRRRRRPSEESRCAPSSKLRGVQFAEPKRSESSKSWSELPNECRSARHVTRERVMPPTEVGAAGPGCCQDTSASAGAGARGPLMRPARGRERRRTRPRHDRSRETDAG